MINFNLNLNSHAHPQIKKLDSEVGC